MSDHLSGLTSESRLIIDSFFRWSRVFLEKNKRDLRVEASAFHSGSLLRESYTRDEVAHMLEGQLLILQGMVDTEVEGTTAAAAELIRSVLREADRQRVVLTIDANAVLSDVSGVNAMGEHGRELVSGPKGRLAPLTLAEASGEAGKQLAEANQEVRRLQEKLRQVTDAYTRVMGGRSADTEQLLSMQDAMNDRERLAAELSRRCPDQDTDLAAAVQQLRAEVMEAKRELTTRLNQSTQYQQVKQLLSQRNSQLKQLRQRLLQLDPTSALGAADDIAPEED